MLQKLFTMNEPDQKPGPKGCPDRASSGSGALLAVSAALLLCLLVASCTTGSDPKKPDDSRDRQSSGRTNNSSTNAGAADSETERKRSEEQKALQALLRQADAAYQAKEYKKAGKKYKQYISRAGFSRPAERILYRLCLNALRFSKPLQYKTWEEQLREWFPGSRYLETLSFRSWEVARIQGEYLKAARLLEKKLENAGLPEAQEVELRIELARLFHRALRHREELDQYLTILRLKGAKEHKARALYKLADWFAEKGDDDLAFTYVSRLLDTYPGSAWQEKARVLYRRLAWRYISDKEGLPSNSVSTIAFDGDDVWVGTWLAGLLQFTRSTDEKQTFTSKETALASNLIRDIAVSRYRIWVATFAGLSYYDKVVGRWKTIYSVAGLAYQRIKAILIDEGKLWVATIAHGVSVLDFASGEWKSYRKEHGLPDNNVVTLCSTPGSIWAGTIRAGLARYDKRSGRWESFQQKGHLPSNNVKSLAFDGTRIWVGTHGGGAASCLEDGTDWRYYRAGDSSGLSSDYVYTIAVAPSGEVWMGTLEGGVSIYNPMKDSWRSLDVRHGLPGNDITAIAFEGNYVWFGTLDGGIAILLTEGGDYE